MTFYDFFIPTICAGILFSGCLLFVYMASRYRSMLYFAVALIGTIGMAFSFCQAMYVITSNMLSYPALGIQFYRVEQVFVALLIFSIPFMLENLLEMNKRWHKINQVLCWIGLGIFVVITAIAFINPDLFVSVTKNSENWHKTKDFAIYQTGILYNMRDSMITLFILYALITMVIDMIWHKNISLLIGPFIGIIIAAYAGIDNIVYSYTGVYPDFVPDVSFSRFSVGISIMIIFFMSILVRRFIDKVQDVEKSNKMLVISEGKYRFLVEETTDLVFSTDLDLNFTTANRSMLRQLKVSEQQIKTLTLYDILYIPPNDKGITLNILHDNIHEFLDSKKTLNFKAHFLAADSSEPKEYQVHLEYIDIDNKKEIIGKATGIAEDTLIRYFHSETQRYVIGNYLITTEEMSARMIRNLTRYLDSQQISLIRLALREMMINAIEHGNLGIDFEEKTTLTNNNNYLQIILSRQNDPQFKDRKVTIDSSIDPEKVIYRIHDEGRGFNYGDIIKRIENEMNKNAIAHGRGITIAKKVFDEVNYNEQGNEVTLIKKFRKN